MRYQHTKISWMALLIFYAVLLAVITFMDWRNHILIWNQWSIQVGLVTLGMVALLALGYRLSDLTAPRGTLLVFSVGILTIIPAVLLSLNPPGDFWAQYFTIGLSMAAGSFLVFLFIRLTRNRL